MTVLVVRKGKASIRGMLSRWMVEVTRGTFVGRPSALVRDRLWDLTISLLGPGGGCLMAFSSQREQGFSVLSHGSCDTIKDHEGLYLQKLRKKLV